MAWRWLLGNRSSDDGKQQRDASAAPPPTTPPVVDPLQAAGRHLLEANRRGDLAKVRELLDSGRIAVDWEDKTGGTVLHRAAHMGRVEVAKLLIERGADVSKQDKTGETPLHWAASWGNWEMAELLIGAGADVRATDKVGATAMHRTLLHSLRDGCTQKSLQTLQVLVVRDTAWDESCDATVAHEDPVSRAVWNQVSQEDQPRWTRQAPALRLCVAQWTEDHVEHQPLTDIPIEEIAGGVERLQIYLQATAASTDTLYRRKICVVGPSEWGKTSLTKSLTLIKPVLEAQCTRTIGIDQFKMSFVHETHNGLRNILEHHEVRFWDYAGQGAYEAMHSVFFSPRTLFFVCIDIYAFKIAMAQADMMADNDSDMMQLMYQFLERSVLRWVRMILARQPDAEFQFLCTKRDALNPCDEILNVEEVATEMVQMVMVIVQEIKDQAENYSLQDSDGEAASELPVVYLGDPRLQSKPKPHVDIIWTSCTRQEDVEQARAAVQDAIIKSAYSYKIPELYQRVLDALIDMRIAAFKNTTDMRIQKTLVDAARLIEQLQTANNIDDKVCRAILETFHNLGDILWFQEIGDPELEKTVILDPSLLIDFIRQVFDHNHTGETMPHATLMRLPFWKDLRNDKRMLSMKRLMQYSHLVYPANGDAMQSGSDLIVPAYWKSNVSAIWVFGGDVLQLGKGFDESHEAVRVHWEIHFTNYMPDTLYDHLVVASYSPFEERQVGPDWMLYQLKDSAGCCRIVTGRDSVTHQQTLHLEAVEAKTATENAAKELWQTFQALCETLDRVLSRNRGVCITSFARDRTHRNPSLLNLRRATNKQLDWLPPEPWRSESLRLLTRVRHSS